ncbi:carn-acyltransf domain-containing protein [Favolaschia claudopus]|uniref:Carn-acyltransf domain-containing protein n=1 Tax=Favolaschia claudopus TaxID=2862362 RepID=A0AAW0C293_9AGAR
MSFLRSSTCLALKPCCRTSFNRPLTWPRSFSTAAPKPKTPPPRRRASDVYRERNRNLLMYSSAVIIATLGVTYAAVPLYRIFCAATGFAGTPNVGTGRYEASRLVPIENAHRIKVHFNADRSESLPWKFTPQQRFVTVLPGETSLAFYTAKNNSKQDIIGIATYNVTPDRVAPYFSKVECFCFEEQKLLAGEEVDMPLLFFIDKDILDDPSCRDIDDIVLSYTFFRARRNQKGQLEPDAAEADIQNSLGFGGYEHAPKAEEQSSSTAPKPLSLARLPVPELRKTLERYLRSIQPFLLQDEAHGGLPFKTSYSLREKWADEFAAGVGKLCQERLLALDRASPNNWLDDNFWGNKTYYEWRSPLIINSNWWLAFHDDELIPAHAKTKQSKITPWQVRRAAWLVHRFLCFKDRLDRQELYPDTTRTGLWLRESVSKMFNIARIPKPSCDILSKPPRGSNAEARKIYVMIHRWCYAISVYDDASPPHSISVQDLETRIRSAVTDAEKRLSAGEKAVPIAVLTADDRDRWTQNLQYLLDLSAQNRRTHQIICQSILGLSLDGPSPTYSPNGQAALTSHLHAIRSIASNATNRIYDKPCTLIVDPSTRAGLTGEHSPCDALVPSIVAEFALVDGVDPSAFAASEPEPFATATDQAGWERLDWDVDSTIETECAQALTRAETIIDNSDNNVFWFDEYGTDWIKDSLKQSPDAFIQMALQLAYYKTRGEFSATYETALTRMFKRGRTETIRSYTVESRAWVLGMMDANMPQQQRRNLLHDALHTHTTLTREAATGRGIDRHLLGLKLMLRPLSGEEAPLLDDELFQRSQAWKLSTSGLSAGNLFRGTGFGASFEDGYGINYLAASDMIKFGIESKVSSPRTSTEGLKDALFEVLSDMRTLCLKTDGHIAAGAEREREISSHL